MNMLEICQEELGRMIAKRFDSYESFSTATARLDALVRGISLVYGDQKDYCSRILDGVSSSIDVALELVEIEEDAA